MLRLEEIVTTLSLHYNTNTLESLLAWLLPNLTEKYTVQNLLLVIELFIFSLLNQLEKMLVVG